MSTSTLAIDIQQDQIAGVLLSIGLKGSRIIESISCPLNTDSDDSESFFTAIQKILPEILEKTGTDFDRCIVGIPASGFHFRVLELPFKNRKKIEQVISFELENYLPLPLEKYESDFCLLENNSRKNSSENLITTASVNQETLGRFQDVLGRCGISPDVLTLGSGYSAALAYARVQNSIGQSAFVFVESAGAAVYIFRNGEILFKRAFRINPGHIAEMLVSGLIHTCLIFNDFFDGHEGLEKVVLSGGFKPDEALRNRIESETGAPVEMFNAFRSARITPTPGTLADDNPVQIHNALALGLNDNMDAGGYNFNRRVSGAALFYQEHKARLVTSLALIILILVAWWINPVAQNMAMEKKIERLDTNIAAVFQSCFPETKVIVDPVRQMQVKIDAMREKKNTNFIAFKAFNIDLLNEISNALPDALDILFTRYVRTEKKLLVTGSADQFNTIDKMKNHLKGVRLFRSVEINSAAMDKIDNRVKFNLEISL